jgi:hypothetical protein
MIMDVNERSKEYAEGKALSAINAAIEQAYIDGYNDGLKHLELEKLEAIKEGVEYVDLNLKSGTLWSSSYVKDEIGVIRRMPFMEASQLSIPTEEDYRELFKECMIRFVCQKDYHGVVFTGINGKSIFIEYTSNDGGDWSRGGDESFRFWLNKNGVKDNEKETASIRNTNQGASLELYDKFMGLHLPVMLVKKGME